MVLPPLATTADLAVLLGRTFTEVEEAQAAALLDQASSVVRAYLRQDLTRATTTDTFLLRAADSRLPYMYGCGGQIVLPQRPVVSVTQVKVAGVVTLDWWLDDVVLTVRSGPWLQPPAAHQAPQVEVTYTHGWDPVPGDVQAVVMQAANRAMVNPSQVRSESVGAISTTYLIPATGEALGVLLSKTEMKVLDRYKRPSGTVRLRPV